MYRGSVMEIHESAEMYLETILVLKNRCGAVRSIDIANEMGFSRPTISIAVRNLKETEHLTVDENGLIELTAKGYDIASKIYERHILLSEILVKIGVDKKHADKDACKIEHDLSSVTFDCIKRYYNNGNL